MSLGKIPRLTRTEAEQVAEHIWARWVGMTGKSPPIVTDEAKADVIQAVFAKACAVIEERPEHGEGDAA